MTPVLIPPPPEPRSPLQATALVAFLIFTLGTTFYALGVTTWSGSRVASFDVRGGAVVPPPRFTLRRPASRAYEVGPVHLEPGQSPVRVLAHVGFQPRALIRPSCRVSMRGANHRTLWSESRDLGASSAGQYARHARWATLELRTFAVPKDGNYTFVVDAGPHGFDEIQSLRLEVRSRVASVQWWFVCAGGCLAIMSLGVVVIASPQDGFGSGKHSRAA